MLLRAHRVVGTQQRQQQVSSGLEWLNKMAKGCRIPAVSWDRSKRWRLMDCILQVSRVQQ
jgi:hypothetical protein